MKIVLIMRSEILSRTVWKQNTAWCDGSGGRVTRLGKWEHVGPNIVTWAWHLHHRRGDGDWLLLRLGQRNLVGWMLLRNEFLCCWYESRLLGKRGPWHGKLLLWQQSELLRLRLQLWLLSRLLLWLLRWRKWEDGGSNWLLRSGDQRLLGRRLWQGGRAEVEEGEWFDRKPLRVVPVRLGQGLGCWLGRGGGEFWIWQGGLRRHRKWIWSCNKTWAIKNILWPRNILPPHLMLSFLVARRNVWGWIGSEILRG